MMVQCVISFGLIQKIHRVGALVLEAQGKISFFIHSKNQSASWNGVFQGKQGTKNNFDVLFCRYLFGSDVVAQFNQANDIEMICRAHQLVMEVSLE